MEGKRQANCFKPFKLIPISVRFHMRCHNCPTKLVTFHAKTYINSFPFSNKIPFRSRLKEICICSSDLSHVVKKSLHPFECLDCLYNNLNDLLTRLVLNIHPFKRLAHPFDKNVQLFKPLAHPFGKNFQPSKRFAHSSIGTSIHSNSLS